jgi:hypothetical protein
MAMAMAVPSRLWLGGMGFFRFKVQAPSIIIQF